MNRFFFRRAAGRSRDDNPERRYARLTGWTFVGMLVLFGIAGLTAFLLTLQGPEQTQVPDLEGDELAQALIDLQDRRLNPYVQLRFHSDPALRGRVISQDPDPGAVVRAGRRITLLVSQGSVLDEVEDYRGMRLDEVRTALQALGAGGDGALFIDAVSYIFDDAEAGTIVGQSPDPGTELSGQTGLDLVVSRGPDVERFSLPAFLGLDWADALSILSRENIPFVFRTEPQPSVGQEGVVVGQSPDPGEQVAPETPVELTIRDVRSVPEGEEFGIFDRTLPEYAVSVELSAVAVGPGGESTTLFNMSHPGGRLAFPYRLPYGSTIIVYRFDTEVIRFVVREPESED